MMGTEWITLRGAFPLSGKNWQQMLDMLNAMKPSLVNDTESSEKK